MPWVIIDNDGQYFCNGSKQWKWTLMLRKACKLDTKDEAESLAKSHVRKRQWWVMEVSWQEVRGKKDAEGPRAWLPYVRKVEQGKDMTDEEVAELPHRTMAVRLLFGATMPDGIDNPYYVGAACVADSDRYYERRQLVDALVEMLKKGEAHLPRYENGEIALPLPRKANSGPLGFLAVESLDTNWRARVNRKGESRRG